MAETLAKSARMESAVREMVHRRQTQSLGKLSGSTSDHTSPQQGGHYLGRRAGRETHADLSAIASRRLPVRECFETKQDREGRSRHYLPAEYSRSGDRDAGLRAHRRGPL